MHTCSDGFKGFEIANQTCSCQSRGSKSRDFYATTVAALNAKERSDQATQQKLLDAQRAAQAPVKSETSPPAAKPPEEKPASQKSIAGRKKVKGGDKWDKVTGKDSATVGDRVAGTQDAKTTVVETKEEHEVEVELNSILKKGPSLSTPPPFLIWCDVQNSDSGCKSLTSYRLCSSHCLLQNILPPLQKGQIHPVI